MIHSTFPSLWHHKIITIHVKISLRQPEHSLQSNTKRPLHLVHYVPRYPKPNRCQRRTIVFHFKPLARAAEPSRGCCPRASPDKSSATPSTTPYVQKMVSHMIKYWSVPKVCSVLSVCVCVKKSWLLHSLLLWYLVYMKASLPTLFSLSQSFFSALWYLFATYPPRHRRPTERRRER